MGTIACTTGTASRPWGAPAGQFAFDRGPRFRWDDDAVGAAPDGVAQRWQRGHRYSRREPISRRSMGPPQDGHGRPSRPKTRKRNPSGVSVGESSRMPRGGSMTRVAELLSGIANTYWTRAARQPGREGVRARVWQDQWI